MKRLLVCCSTLYVGSICLAADISAQKPPLDTIALTQWAEVSAPAISNDGAYMRFVVREGSYTAPATLVIQARTTSWRKELVGIRNAVFTDDSRRAIYLAGGDSLALLTLGTSSVNYIPQVQFFELTKPGKTEWLIYRTTTEANELVFQNLATGRRQSFAGTTEHWLSHDGNSVVVHTESETAGRTIHALRWVSLADGHGTTFWEGANAGNIIFDETGIQLAFTVTDTTPDHAGTAFWYYKTGMAKAAPLATNRSAGVPPDLRLDGISRFSRDGRFLFVSLLELEHPTPKPDAVRVDVWSYLDPKLQSQQLAQLNRGARSYAAVIPIGDPRIIRLEQEHEAMQEGTDDLVWITHSRTGIDEGERHWNTAAQRTAYVVSTRTGERTPVKVSLRYPSPSPDGRYLAGADDSWSDIYSYEVATGIVRNMTRSLPIPSTLGEMLERDEMDTPQFEQFRGLLFVGWLASGDVLVYDAFDIWQVDPVGKHAPVNLTNGYGRRHQIEFRLMDESGIVGGTIPKHAKVVLRALDRTTKHRGYYQVALGQKRDPELLSMGPYVYNTYLPGKRPIKARDAEVYLVGRESATQAPNYFVTTNFRTFVPLSKVSPEKKYNWLTSELMAFRTVDGRTEQGVLYKPEDFDSTKRYPVILHYYERMSQDMNRYRKPGDENGLLDIPWFVSRGYLVFTPDIHYATGEIGQGAYNSIVGAAQHLKQFPWVDATKLGLQGHSFGGYETNYVVTQTNLFAAAVSSSGPSDLVSGYNGFFVGQKSAQGFYERSQNRMGGTLWERPESYIKNSPIFHLDKVTTPLLTVANKADYNVPFVQGVELFTALRRLGKRAWMLQYDDGGHGVNGKDRIDYIIRMTQFFDHYLKGAPAPRWMTRGIPARMKGVDDGLALDPEIPTPGPGLIAESGTTSAATSAPQAPVVP